MRSEHESLLATAAAHPDDDLPRLVLADWLDDHAATDADRARAAFIRQQVAEWRNPFPWETDGPSTSLHSGAGGVRTEQDADHPRPSLALLERHRDDWLAFLPAKQRAWVNFERGFLEGLRPAGSRTGFVKLLEKPHPEMTTARRLRLPMHAGMRPGDYVTLAKSPGLRRVRALEFEDDVSGVDVSALLANARHLDGLTELAFLSGVTELWAAMLEERAGGVRDLFIAAAEYDGAAGPPAAAAELPGLRSVERLTLGWLPAPAATLWHDGLLEPDVTPKLASLRVSCGRYTLVAERLFAGLDRPGLRRLCVGWGGARSADPIARAAANNLGLGGLTALGVSCGPVSPDVFAAVVESPHLANVRRLDVRLSDDPANAGPAYEYLLADVPADRYDKLWVGHHWDGTAFAGPLRDKFGDRLQMRSDDALHRTLERLGLS